jgi:cytidylate kinase
LDHSILGSLNPAAAMTNLLQFDLCRAYLSASSTATADSLRRRRTAGPTITLSREAGARGNSIAAALIPLLQAHPDIPRFRPWTLFNQNLIDHVIAEHQLPEKTADFFPEDKPDEISTIIGEMLGLHPGSHDTAVKVAETIRRLAKAGNSIIVGRGANLIAAGIPHSIHVRLVGSPDVRRDYYARHAGLSPDQAAAEISRLDRARKRYLRANFKADIDDPLLYDLTLQTDRWTDEQIARLIINALEEKLAA